MLSTNTNTSKKSNFKKEIIVNNFLKKIAVITLGVSALTMSLGVHSQQTRQLIKASDSTSVTATAGPSIVIPALPSDICTSSNTNCYNANRNPLPSTSGGLGNRIGTFSNSAYANTKYVLAKLCTTSGGQDTFLSVAGGPYSDGTFLWALYHGNVTLATATCYFNGTAGTFSMSAFSNTSNQFETWLQGPAQPVWVPPVAGTPTGCNQQGVPSSWGFWACPGVPGYWSSQDTMFHRYATLNPITGAVDSTTDSPPEPVQYCTTGSFITTTVLGRCTFP